MGKLNGKNVIITGGSTGIGFATARRFIQEGAKVIITGRTQQTLDGAKAELGPNAIAVRSDASNLEDLDHLISVAKQELGGVDVLFLNAGVARFTPVDQQTPEDFHQQFAINVFGPYFAVQKALPILNPGASIFVNASAVSTKGMAGASVYSATKAAVRSLTRTLAAELSPRGFRVNTLSPGPVETPIYGKLGMSQEEISGFAESVVAGVPLGRFGNADELAGAALFLASSDSSYMTGADLVIDGGFAQV